MTKKHLKPRRAAAPFTARREHRRALWDRIAGSKKVPASCCGRLLREIEETGSADGDVVEVGEVERLVNDFTGDIIKSIPLEHHEAVREAIEKFSQRLEAAAEE